MKLNISERIALLGVLPEMGNAVNLRVIDDLRRELGFTEEEAEHLGIKNTTLPDGRANVTWKPEAAKETKDIKIGEIATNIITEQLKKLNQQNQLHISMLPLYNRFVDKQN